MTFDEALAECLDCNETFIPPMAEKQVEKIVKSIERREAAKQAERSTDYEHLCTWYYRG